MRIKNNELEIFANFLLSLELRGRDSRMRTRFVKLLRQQLEEVRVEYNMLLDEHCNKNEDGTFKRVKEKGQEFYDVPNIGKFNEEYTELMEEELIIVENESNKKMLETVKENVLQCNKIFSGKEALEYDRYCDIVENYEVIEG